MTLIEALTDSARRNAAAAEILKLVESEVEKKRGLTGMALKAGYAVVKAVKPGFVQNVLDDLFDDFAKSLEPLIAQALTRGRSVAETLIGEKDRVAEALLGVTDARVASSKLATVKAAYERLRGAAKAHVAEAVPGLAAILEKMVR